MTKGQRIRYRREELNISQSELAERIGESKQTLYKYEKDIITNIPSDKVEAIARVLETTPAYIMGWQSGDIPEVSRPERNEIPELEERYSVEEVAKAMRLYHKYKHALPQVQEIVESLLKPHQSDV